MYLFLSMGNEKANANPKSSSNILYRRWLSRSTRTGTILTVTYWIEPLFAEPLCDQYCMLHCIIRKVSMCDFWTRFAIGNYKMMVNHWYLFFSESSHETSSLYKQILYLKSKYGIFYDAVYVGSFMGDTLGSRREFHRDHSLRIYHIWYDKCTN